MGYRGGWAFLAEVHCARCGKLFVLQPYHRFKDKGKYYCKWTCYNHRNDKDEKEKTKNEKAEMHKSVSKDHS